MNEDFNSNQCVNKFSQDCKYMSGKCPCKLKKTMNEERYEQDEKYVHDHWKSVVLCRECKYYGLTNHPDICRKIVIFVKPDGWCYMGERK